MPAKRTGPERFSDRVENYVRYRPDYPGGVIEILEREVGLRQTWKIADIGAGTGLSSQLFLENGNEVFGVEPNLPMRMAAQHYLAGYKGYHSVAGTAEATTLPSVSIDCVVAAQAFHWFDPAAARAEALRVLKPPGWAVLLWNTRRVAGSPPLEAYEQLLAKFGTDYQTVRHDHMDVARIETFFGGPFDKTSTPHEQSLDLDGLRGRVLSSSYMPLPGDPRYAALSEAIEAAFAQSESQGRVTLLYDTEIYWARLS